MAYDRGYLAEILDFNRAQLHASSAEESLPAAGSEEDLDADEIDLDDRFEKPLTLKAIFDQFSTDAALQPQAEGSLLESLIPGPPTSADTFASFFDRLGIRNFSPSELLVLGGNNTSGPCKGRNYIPAKLLWPRIAPSIAALDSIRDKIGYAIYITNAFRSPEYNACLRTISDGVAKFSQHIEFRAIDFKGGSGSSAEWYTAVTQFKDQNPEFGIWTKRYPTFVHIDTRGA